MAEKTAMIAAWMAEAEACLRMTGAQARGNAGQKAIERLQRGGWRA
jgi:hypothetical protein